jgi:hypothetical protein
MFHDRDIAPAMGRHGVSRSMLVRDIPQLQENPACRKVGTLSA